MLLNRLFRSRTTRQPVKPTTLHSRWNAAILRLEALDERVVPSFADPVIYPVGPGAYSLAAADLTGDGILDLAASTPFPSHIGVLAGNGDGSFQPAQLSSALGGSLLAGDVDGDGKADLIVSRTNNLDVLISNGNGTFQPAQSVTLPPQMPPDYTGEPLPQSIGSAVVGDLNADGLLDLVAIGTTGHTIMSGPGSYGGYYYYYVSSTYVNVLIGTGLGTFDRAATSLLSQNSYGWPYTAIFGPDVGDFNGDGNLDLLTSMANISGGGSWVFSGLSAWLGNGDGTLQSPQWTGTYSGTHFVQHAVGDFNQDGKSDVLMGGQAFATATVALSNGDGTFTPLNPFDVGIGLSNYWTTTEVGDVNGDGKNDLVLVNNEHGNLASLLLGDGDGKFAKPIKYDLGPFTYALQSPTLADFDGDGFADLAAANQSIGVLVHMNSGSSDLPPPDLRITDASTAEGNLGTQATTFTVTLTRAATEPVTVWYATANGTAASGSDYQAAADTITFAPGETEKTITVLVNGDRVGEETESFLVNLSGATNATIVDVTGVGTILDDEPRVWVSDVSAKEGDAGQTPFAFTVTLSAAYDVPVTVDWVTASGTATAGSDYQAATGTLTIPAGETTGTIGVAVLGDLRFETDETFRVHLANAGGALIADGTGVGTIVNDDPNATRIRIGDVAKKEGRFGMTLFVFKVILSAPSAVPVTVNYTTSDGTAKAGEDYVAASGTLTFAPGQTTKRITIKVKGDQMKESGETFAVNLSGATNASILDGTGLGTILNDDR